MVGLAAGSAGTTSTAGTAPAGLGQIPLRCLAAFEEGEASFRDCRRPSLRAEILAQSRVSKNGDPFCFYTEPAFSPGSFSNESGFPAGDCDVEKNLTWEVKALQALAKGPPKPQ